MENMEDTKPAIKIRAKRYMITQALMTLKLCLPHI